MIIDQHSAKLTMGFSTLSIMRGTITMDDTRAPMIEARIQVLNPPDPGEVDARDVRRATLRLEQRFGAIAFSYDFTELHAGKSTAQLTTQYAAMTTAQITATFGWYAAAGGASNGRTLNLILDSTRSTAPGVVELVLQSDECRLIDNLLYEFQPQVYTPATISGLVAQVNAANAVRGFLFYSSLNASRYDPEFPAGLYAPTPSARSLEITPGTSLWDALQAPLRETGARIYSIGTGELILDREDWTDDTVVPVAAGVNLLEYSDEFAADPDVWGDAAIVLYDSAQPGTGYIASLSLSQGTFSRPLLLRVPGVSPVSSFSPNPPAIAERTLARLQGRGRVQQLTVVNDYRLTPRAQLQITLPDDAAYTARVQAVEMQIGDRWETTITAQEVTAA